MKTMIALAALAAASGSALAASYDAFRSGFDGGSGITVNGVDYQGGHLVYTYDGSPPAGAAGQFAGPSFRTFCIELEQFASTSTRTYDIIDLEDAPNPASTGGPNPNPNDPNPYGSAIAQRIHEVVAEAIDQQWLNDDLSLGALGNTQTNIAVQAAIWDAIFGGTSVSDLTVQGYFNTLVGNYGSGELVDNLRAAVSENAQDVLYVVPLPPAAFAGLATLVGIAGVSRLRRR